MGVESKACENSIKIEREFGHFVAKMFLSLVGDFRVLHFSLEGGSNGICSRQILSPSYLTSYCTAPPFMPLDLVQVWKQSFIYL